MVRGTGGNQAQRTLVLVVAMMADPCFTQHQPAKALGPVRLVALVVEAVVGKGAACRNVEGMGRCPHADHRPATFEIVVNLLHLVIRQIAKAGSDHHQLSLPQGLEARNVFLFVGGDLARFWIDGVEHRAVKAMAGRQNLGQLRQRLLAAVLLITADQHHLLTLAGTITTRKGIPGFGCPGPGCRYAGEQQDN